MANGAQPHVDLTGILNLLQFITSAVLIPGAFVLVKRLSEIRDHLARINGAVADLTRWRADHEALAEREHEYHEETRRQCRQNTSDRLKYIDQNLEQVWGRIGDRRRYPQDRTD